MTLSERFAKADAALLVQWVSARPAKGDQPDATTYEIVEVRRQGEDGWKKGQQLTVPGFHSGKPGNLVFLMGGRTSEGDIKWDDPPLDATETAFQYIVQAPTPETPCRERLPYFMRFLEYPDATIANDAFAEFVNAPAEDIFALADKLPREKLRRWLQDEKIPTRQSGYGLMLGLCGERQDARLLEERIADDNEERRTGIEGVMVGYLLLAGEKGLEQLERTILKDPGATDGDAYAACVALRYFWSYGEGRISKERIQQAMHLLLDRPKQAESAIADLARWKDWSVQPRVVALYEAPGFDGTSVKRAIIKYLIAATKDVAKEAGEKPPAHAVAASKSLSLLRRKDPKLVAETEKFFYLN